MSFSGLCYGKGIVKQGKGRVIFAGPYAGLLKAWHGLVYNVQQSLADHHSVLRSMVCAGKKVWFHCHMMAGARVFHFAVHT